ncbi:T9SS type A sorting domain-containing protein [uncultured Algoriphagus sp.]|uniref:T9SS type A sorting domain-containing protein n=1 Tax=uncultured Algoriphagus sp. TaxID=417365 RepID=UPI0030EF8AAC|tara:strand:+ start:4747 stop:7059 length:2313 start_codon:yes stop_codon:yes gene_type:complete
MKTRGKTLACKALFQCRIYLIFSAVAFHCLYINVVLSQEIGAFRTVASGNFGNISIWEIYNGTIWVPASTKPSQANDIYIDQSYLLTLTGNEEVKSLLINAETGANQKLNLNGNNLNIYGTLQAFSGAAPGVPSGSWNSQNWIGNSIVSTLTFKGTSRIIIPKNAWSGFTTQSRYTVIFDPSLGNTLTIEEPFKAVKFIIRTGTLLQKLDTSVSPNFCASLSFNTETTFYPSGAFGDFIIENGATFISECSDKIIARSISGSVSANLFDLQSGGELLLLGSSPQIETANFQLNGKVTFRKTSGTQSFLSKSYPTSASPLTFHDLEIQGSQNVTLPPTLSVTGNMSKVGAGSFLTNSSHITFTGNHDQTISGFPLSPMDLTVNKSDGKVILEQSLSVLRNLTMLSGKLDFQNNHLAVNSSGLGAYYYAGGSWENLSKFTYANTPTILSTTNSTFPFGDRYHGGIRKVQMLGIHDGGNLTIDYTEYKGADFNPGFNDTGGIPILYRLFSYFNFSGLNPSSNPLELRISADKLIVDEPEDLRLVCTGYAAPGNHIESLDEVNLWAIRSLTFNDLPAKNFTIGSFRTLSILPVTWLSVSAEIKNKLKKVSWSVAQEKDNEKFEIYHSIDPLEEWTKIGEVFSKGDSGYPVSYAFMDKALTNDNPSYYQIRQVDFGGKWSWSQVVRLENSSALPTDKLSIYPNPHFQGKIGIDLPNSFNSESVQVLIFSAQGNMISSFSFHEVGLSDKLEGLKPGLYLISFSNSETTLRTRWIKR